MKNATVDTVCDIWTIAIQHNAKQLAETCQYFVTQEYSHIKTLSNFSKLPKELQDSVKND